MSVFVLCLLLLEDAINKIVTSGYVYLFYLLVLYGVIMCLS